MSTPYTMWTIRSLRSELNIKFKFEFNFQTEVSGNFLVGNAGHFFKVTYTIDIMHTYIFSAYSSLKYTSRPKISNQPMFSSLSK